MSVYKLDNGRWRVQVRHKGFPNCEGVFATQRDAKAHEATFVAGCKAAARPLDVTLSALWERYAASPEYRAKSDSTPKTEASSIKPVLAWAQRREVVRASSLNGVSRLGRERPVRPS